MHTVDVASQTVGEVVVAPGIACCGEQQCWTRRRNLVWRAAQELLGLCKAWPKSRAEAIFETTSQKQCASHCRRPGSELSKCVAPSIRSTL